MTVDGGGYQSHVSIKFIGRSRYEREAYLVRSKSARKGALQPRDTEHTRVGIRHLLGHPGYRRLIVAQAIAQTCDAAATVVLTSAVLLGPQDGSIIGRLTAFAASSAAPIVLAGPLAGIGADRVSRRVILGAGQSLRGVLLVVAWIGVISSRTWIVVACWAAGLCVARILYTARIASLRHLVARNELVAADSLSLTVGSVAGGVGGSIGVVASFGSSLGLVPLAILHLVAAILYLGIGSRLGGGREHVPATSRRVAEHLLAPKMRFAIASTSLHRLLLGIMFAMVAMAAGGASSQSAIGFVGAVGASGLGSFVGNLLAETANARFNRRSLTVFVFAFSSLIVAGIVLTDVLQARYVGLLLLACAFQTMRVCADATVQSNAVRGAGGREFAAYDMSHNLMFLGGIIVGLHGFSLGIGRVGMTVSLVCVFLSFVFGRMKREEPLRLASEFSGITPHESSSGEASQPLSA